MIDKDKIPVGQAENLIGKVFGRLTVLYRVKSDTKNRSATWRCRCSCGATTDVIAPNLKRGHTLSCGCLQREKTSESRFIDETGNRYGRLTVLQRAEDYVSPKGFITPMWLCMCDCGNQTTVNVNSLRKGATISCGCYQKEQVSNRSADKYIGKTFHYITVLEKTLQRQKNNESYWKCKCNLCNEEFFIPTSRLKTQVSCGCLKDSYGITIIKSLLNNNDLPFITEKTFESCVFPQTGAKARFDFYVNNTYLIEFDGQQHFHYSGGWNNLAQLKNTQEHDNYKNDWCRKNNIPLIRIPYWEIENLTIEDLTLKSRFLLSF